MRDHSQNSVTGHGMKERGTREKQNKTKHVHTAQNKSSQKKTVRREREDERDTTNSITHH